MSGDGDAGAGGDGEAWCGEGALRLPLPAGVPARAASEALRALPGAIDVVVVETCALVTFAPASPIPIETARAALAAASSLSLPPPRTHELRVRYDGEDLPRVAAAIGRSVAETIALHAAPLYEVKLVGFAPGFAYLGDVPEPLRLPRLPRPRPRVPAGAVGIAGARTGVYPLPSPGGWNLLGTALGFSAFDPSRGAALALGDRVRFLPVEES